MNSRPHSLSASLTAASPEQIGSGPSITPDESDRRCEFNATLPLPGPIVVSDRKHVLRIDAKDSNRVLQRTLYTFWKVNISGPAQISGPEIMSKPGGLGTMAAHRSIAHGSHYLPPGW